MTVASTLNKKQYQGNSLTVEFPLPFHVTAKEHIFALRKKGTAIEEIKNNFAVDLERKVFIYPLEGEPLKNDESLTVYRKIPLTQIVDLENAGAFHPEVLEYDGFDRIVMQIQQLDEEISRALKIDITDTRDTSHLLEELFAAREEAVFYAQKALEQAQIAVEKTDKTKEWAQFAEEKVKELTDLSVECFISNNGQGQVNYDKEGHKLEIVLPFDNSGSQQPKVVLTDSTDLARSDIGASAKAVHSLQEDVGNVRTESIMNLAAKIDKTAISSALDSENVETVANSYALNELRKSVSALAMPGDKFIDIELKEETPGSNMYSTSITAPAAGYVYLNFRIEGQAVKGWAYARVSVKRNGVYFIEYADRCEAVSGGYPSACAFGPVQKGDVCTFYKSFFDKTQQTRVFSRFYYAQGEI